MARIVKGGLVQCSNPINDLSVSIEEVLQAGFDKHLPFIDEAGDRIVLDLAKTSFLDSGSIVLLLEAHKAALKSGGGLAIAAPPPLIHKCFSTLGLLDVFAVHPTVDDAIASFA